MVDFDDETKLIRAETDRLMRRIYTSIPHPRNSTPLQILPYYGSLYHTYDPKPLRERHINSMIDDILSMSYYSEPSAKTIGRGHLACVTYAGGRGYPRRKHLYSDENRDIGDEIRTRSYYHNNYNKAYLDAMTLPTGFASYLLRIKPPEKEPLTNIDKMHIIALAEERKRSNKINKNEEDPFHTKTLELTNGYVPSTEKARIEPLKKTKVTNQNVERTEKPKIDDTLSHEDNEVIASVNKKDLTSVESVPKELTPVESVPEESIVPPKEELEPTKPEKKSKVKRSLSKTPSLSDATSSLADDKKPDLEKNIPLAAKQENDALESQKIKSSSGLKKSIEKQQEEENKRKMSTPVLEPPKTEPTPVSEVQKTEETPVEETQKEELRPVDEPPKTEPTPDEEVKITTPIENPQGTETMPIEEHQKIESTPLDEQQKTEQIAPAEPEKTELTTAAEPQSTEPLPLEELQNMELAQKDEIAEGNNEKTESGNKSSEETKDNVVSSETMLKEQEPVEEISPLKKEDIVKDGESNLGEQCADVPVFEKLESNEPTESVKEEDEKNPDAILDEPAKQESQEISSQRINDQAADEERIETANLIEDVTDMGPTEAVKENETEPLIEEPQSPSDSQKTIPDKSSHEITEVLSDVPEES